MISSLYLSKIINNLKELWENQSILISNLGTFKAKIAAIQKELQ